MRHYPALAILLVQLVVSCTTTRAHAGDADPLYLDQGWSPEPARQKFYQRPQGSKLLPYEWFLVLEQPHDDHPFRADDFIRRFRYLPSPPTAENPDGLPLGFVKSRRDGADWLGLTCAACHTAQFEYGGRAIRIDGGPTLADIVEFQQAVTDALRATRDNPKKLDRFAAKLSVAGSDPDSTALLKSTLDEQIAWHSQWGSRNRPVHASGFGRWDAMHIAFNDVTAVAIGSAENYRAPLAPVSYPQIWLSDDLEAVLWNGSVHNILSRSMGEAVIAFGRLKVHDDLSFSSTVDLKELDSIYNDLYSLRAPAWPGDVLGPLDRQRLARGAAIYQREGCAKCHADKPPYPQTEPNSFGRRFIANVRTPLTELGTDPVYAEQFLSRLAAPGIARPLLKGTTFETAPTLPASLLFLGALKEFTAAKLADQSLTDEERKAFQGSREPVSIPQTSEQVQTLLTQLTAYKTQPLAGIWATAPFLHNGSVPNLEQLLLPPEQRVKTFYVGNREFDPVRVGYVSEAADDMFEFDTTLKGNSNAGHAYGTAITDDDRRDLIEYLKSL